MLLQRKLPVWVDSKDAPMVSVEGGEMMQYNQNFERTIGPRTNTVARFLYRFLREESIGEVLHTGTAESRIARAIEAK